MKFYRLGAIVLCGAVLAAGCNRGGDGKDGAAGDAAGKDDKASAELQWAEGVADAFLQNLRSRDYDQQPTLTTEAFRTAYKDTKGRYQLRPEATLRSWEFARKTVSPGADECRLAGPCKFDVYGLDGVTPSNRSREKDGEFVLLLARESAGSHWRVNFVNIQFKD